ncbi:MAG: hypothetical protein Q4G00_15605 [Clostridia bacterium]|nr:hypothetical protein [Clostridia bacterium]
MLYAAAFGALAGAMMVFPGEAAEAAWQGIGLWARSIAPVLGPFMVCMLMLASRAGGGPALKTALGWLCGSPGGARLMQNTGLTGPAALRFAAMTGTMSPMFFLGTVSAWLNRPAAGRVVFACHLLGAFLIGLCFPREEARAQPPLPMPLGQALRDSVLALLTVGLCMMLGCTVARMAACAFPHLPAWGAAALQCALEVTSGVKALIALHTPWTAPLICAACSFGGLSILLQNAAFWQECGVTMGQLALLRALHAALSGCLCWIVLRVFFPL